MSVFASLFGTSAQTIEWWQLSLRTILVFAYLLILLRVGGRRAFGRLTNFDLVVAILLGSTMSRTLTANAPLGPTMAGAAVLVVLHWLIAKLAFWRPGIGWIIEGHGDVLVRNGALQREAMERSAIKEADLLEALRASAGTEDLTNVKVAYLERNGRISFVRD